MAQDGEIRQHPNGGTYKRQNGQWVLQSAPQSASGPISLTGPDPKLPFDVQSAGNKAAASAFDPALAAADLEAKRRAAAEASAKAAREAKEGEDAIIKERRRTIADDLQADNVLNAIERARGQIDSGHAAGNFYGSALFQATPLVGQNAADLAGTLSGLQGSVINDMLKQLKELSATGASGFGALSEKEGDRIAASVAALQQTQSPEALRQSLADLERHYRNAKAILNGEDPREPDVAKRYGVITKDAIAGAGRPDRSTPLANIPGGGGPNEGLSRDGARTESDPTLAGLNAEIRRRIGRGDSASHLASYVNSINPGLGREMLPRFRDAVNFRKQNPSVPLENYPIDLERRDVPMSGADKLVNSLGQSPLGAFTMAGADVLTLGNLDSMTGNPERARAGMAQVASENPLSSLGGTLTGGVLAGAGIEAGLGAAGLRGAAGALAPRAMAADGLFGAGYGAGSDDENRLRGAALGLPAGIGGGIFGRGVTGGLGRAARGVQDPEVRYLDAEGVRMTPGSMMGGRMKTREDRLAGFQGIGNTINDQRRASFMDMNRAAFRQGLEPYGATGVSEIGERGIEQAGDSVSDLYNRTLGGVRVQADGPFGQEFPAAVGRAGAIPRVGPEIVDTLGETIPPMFDAAGGLSGRDMQAVVRSLGQTNRAYRNDPLFGQRIDPALGDVEQSIVGMFERQAPDVMPGFRDANTAYRNRRVLGKAVESGLNTDGIFTAAQLGQAARQSGRRFGNNADTTDRPFFELQRAAQNVLPSSIPDSGTAGRASGPIRDTVRNIVNAPLYSDTLQPVIRSLLLERPDEAIRIGNELVRRQRLGGMFGAPLAVQATGN